MAAELAEAELAEILQGHPFPAPESPEFAKAGLFVMDELRRRYSRDELLDLILLAGSVPDSFDRWLRRNAAQNSLRVMERQ